MNHWVMDYETLSNTFVAVFKHYKKDLIKVFVIHDLRNDYTEFIKFLHENIDLGERHISYNGLGFDAQVTEHVLKKEGYWNHLSGCQMASEIYKIAQDTISRTQNRDWLDFYEGNMCIPQIDVFKLNHWDNPAKRSSLKWIQFSMDWHNLQDMPIHHTTYIKTMAEINDIIGYCINDVLSTEAILYLSKDQISLRKTLTQEYGINLYSASEPKISKELFLHFLVQKTGWKKNDIKYARTKRNLILAREILLPYIKFDTPLLQNLLEKFRTTTIDPLNTKGSLKYTVKDRGMKIDFGLGGVHGARRSGVYEATDGMTIMSSDVKSYYPNLAIRNGWSPAHLPREIFCELYEWFYDERLKIPKSDPRNYVYKIILNSTYGLSNDKHSFLYDPQFTMQITINGQLSLMMLYEMIMEQIPGAVSLLINTDGLETIIPTEYVEKYLKICAEWEKLTKLVLEHDEYQKLILADVNNYIAINKFQEVSKEKYNKILDDSPHALVQIDDGKHYHADVKCKGRFEFNNLALHKNKSALVIPKALYDFFVHDISPERHLASNQNIFDYCIGKKIKGAWNFEERTIVKGEFVTNKLQPTVRYFITEDGVKIIKCHNTDGREIQVESGKWLMTVMNKFEEKEWKDYGVNEQYYSQAIYKEIENIAGSRVQQLSLF
jgi:hypothetical protein